MITLRTLTLTVAGLTLLAAHGCDREPDPFDPNDVDTEARPVEIQVSAGEAATLTVGPARFELAEGALTEDMTLTGAGVDPEAFRGQLPSLVTLDAAVNLGPAQRRLAVPSRLTLSLDAPPPAGGVRALALVEGQRLRLLARAEVDGATVSADVHVLGIYVALTVERWIDLSRFSQIQFAVGASTDCPVPGDADADGVADCWDGCDVDPTKAWPGFCGCTVPDSDHDADGVVDCAQPTRVFVTSTEHLGDFGGQAGADAICAERAEAAALDGAWQAWISGDRLPARDRLTAASSYELLDGTVLAEGYGDWLDGALAAPIDLDEGGVRRASPEGIAVWTGTMPDGSAATRTCRDWTGFTTAVFGRIDEADASWVQDGEAPCTNARRLYCMER